MSRVGLYVDEDASELAVIRGLRARGVDLLTTLEAGRLGASDSAQLDFATEQNRSIYTFNVNDFSRLHREYLKCGREHEGIIVIPDQRCSVGEKIRGVGRLVAAVKAADMLNRIEYL